MVSVVMVIWKVWLILFIDFVGIKFDIIFDVVDDINVVKFKV